MPFGKSEKCDEFQQVSAHLTALHRLQTLNIHITLYKSFYFDQIMSNELPAEPKLIRVLQPVFWQML